MNAQHDLICLSHLRWNFVYQRPQHLMTRAARERRVLYMEENVYEQGCRARLDVRQEDGVTVIVPHLPSELSGDAGEDVARELLRAYLVSEGVRRPVAWVYTPMRLPLLDGLETSALIYDCMDELANFHGAPPELQGRERQLLARADVVFTGGERLWEAKRMQHPSVHPFPSSVDAAHFARARAGLPDPADQRGISRPRLGFFGVIDERFDTGLLRELAARRPAWQFVLIGPTVKINPDSLPRGENVHYLGMKGYAELPSYLAHWDVALLPFARNAATEFISPTKTPEYLAAGVPVVSTDIRDVVRPWGEAGAARIAGDVDTFEAAIQAALTEDNAARLSAADALLAGMSWDRTWAEMDALIKRAEAQHAPPLARGASVVGAADD